MKRLFYFSLVALSLSAGACVHFRPLVQHKVTFVLYNADEARAMRPIFDYLRSRNVGLEIVAIGPAQRFVKDDPAYIDLQKKCGISDRVGSKWARELPIPSSEMARLRNCIQPTLILTGLFSSFQEQVAKEMSGRTQSIWGYFDSFKKERISEVSEDFVASLAKILVPSYVVKKAFSTRIPDQLIEVVGEPNMEEWRRYAAKTDARKILEKLDLTKTFPVIVYIGGVGKDYEASFQAFAKEVPKLNDCIVLVSLHPDSNGVFEKKALEEAHAIDVRVIPKSISTEDAAIISDVIVTYRSRDAVQAVFLNKPVVYFDLQGATYTDLALENGWARQISKVDEFVPLIRGRLRERIYNTDKDVFAEYGIPKDSVTVLGRMLESRVLD